MNDLINSLLELEEVKRYKRLEQLVDSKIEYKDLLEQIFEIQKQITNAKHYNLEETLSFYTTKYNNLIKKLQGDILIEMFLESLAEVNEILFNVTSIIEEKINK